MGGGDNMRCDGHPGVTDVLHSGDDGGESLSALTLNTCHSDDDKDKYRIDRSQRLHVFTLIRSSDDGKECQCVHVLLIVQPLTGNRGVGFDGMVSQSRERDAGIAVTLTGVMVG